MTAQALYYYLDKRIPASLSCDWDNDGLMCCPDERAEVKRVLIALDITERVADYAIENGFDTIVSHHPLIFSKVAQLNGQNNTARKLIKLVKHGICAMSFHTRLDAIDNGVNDVLEEILQVKNTRNFGPAGEEIGRVGELDEAMPLSEFCKSVKEKLSCPALLYTDAGLTVRNVAFIGGDGKDYVDEAIAAGADTFVSGRFSYNIMAEAPERGINLIEAGHFYTEDPVCRRLEALIREADHRIETKIINSNEIKVL